LFFMRQGSRTSLALSFGPPVRFYFPPFNQASNDRLKAPFLKPPFPPAQSSCIFSSPFAKAHRFSLPFLAATKTTEHSTPCAEKSPPGIDTSPPRPGLPLGSPPFSKIESAMPSSKLLFFPLQLKGRAAPSFFPPQTNLIDQGHPALTLTFWLTPAAICRLDLPPPPFLFLFFPWRDDHEQ